MNGGVKTTYSPQSIAQMPVPVPTSRIFCGWFPMGAKCNLSSSIRRPMWWTMSSLSFCQLSSCPVGQSYEPVLFFLLFRGDLLAKAVGRVGLRGYEVLDTSSFGSMYFLWLSSRLKFFIPNKGGTYPSRNAWYRRPFSYRYLVKPISVAFK